jgi:hypothetical protein
MNNGKERTVKKLDDWRQEGLKLFGDNNPDGPGVR